MNIREKLGRERLFFDGGTGTLLQAQGLKGGELPETWNLLHPERISAGPIWRLVPTSSAPTPSGPMR